MRIVPNLWFNNNAKEAVDFYLSVFKNSKITYMSHYTDAGQDIHNHTKDDILVIEFEIDGQKFSALNGGELFKFNEAVSFIIPCETQEEIDYYWDKLSEGGDPAAQQCGWLKDRFGVSWQVSPRMLDRLLEDGQDRDKAERAMAAMMKMKKLNIAELEAAAESDEESDSVTTVFYP